MIIYKYTNTHDLLAYIGKTGQPLQRRHQGHKYAAKRGINTYFGNAIRKYGIDSFILEVLCEVDIDTAPFVGDGIYRSC